MNKRSKFTKTHETIFVSYLFRIYDIALYICRIYETIVCMS